MRVKGDEGSLRAQTFCSETERARTALTTYATRLDELARRRESIAAAMAAQNAAWAAFHVNFPPGDPTDDAPQGAGSTRIPDDRGREEAKLYKQDQQVMGDAAQFARDVVAADVECANAINAIDFGTQYHVNGEDVGAHGVGGTAEMFLAAARRGDSPWGSPESWTDSSRTMRKLRGDERFFGSLKEAGWVFLHAAGVGTDGEQAVAREGLLQMPKDIITLAAYSSGTVKQDEFDAASGRMTDMAKSMVSWDNWEHDKNGAWGDLGASALMFVLPTKGLGKVGRVGAGAAGALGRVAIRDAALADAAVALKTLGTKAKNLQVPAFPMRKGGLVPAPAGGPALAGGAGTLGEVMSQWRTGIMEMGAKVRPGAANKPPKPLPTLEPNRVLTRRSGANEATYHTNDKGIVTRVTARLSEYTEKATRSGRENALTRLVGKHGVDGDHGGHLIAHRFMQELGIENFFPQNGHFNTSAWRTMENEWADWIDHGMEVRPTIEKLPHGALRPDSLRVTYQVFDPETGKAVATYRPRFSNSANQVFKRVGRDRMDQLIAARRAAR